MVGRLLLFLVPSALIFIGAGIERIGAGIERISAGIERVHINRVITLILSLL